LNNILRGEAERKDMNKTLAAELKNKNDFAGCFSALFVYISTRFGVKKHFLQWLRN
jgi:hypothetical protein